MFSEMNTSLAATRVSSAQVLFEEFALISLDGCEALTGT
jgi:hypothetical protein